MFVQRWFEWRIIRCGQLELMFVQLWHKNLHCALKLCDLHQHFIGQLYRLCLCCFVLLCIIAVTIILLFSKHMLTYTLYNIADAFNNNTTNVYRTPRCLSLLHVCLSSRLIISACFLIFTKLPWASTLVFMATLLYSKARCWVFLFLLFFLFCQPRNKRPIKTVPLLHKHFTETDIFFCCAFGSFFFTPLWHGMGPLSQVTVTNWDWKWQNMLFNKHGGGDWTLVSGSLE